MANDDDDPLHDLVRSKRAAEGKPLRPFLFISVCVHKFRLRELFGSVLSEHELAKRIYKLDADYRLGQFFETAIIDQTNAIKSGRLKGPFRANYGLRHSKEPNRGRYPKKPTKLADQKLIVEAAKLLAGMSPNKRVGWSAWDDLAADKRLRRKKSGLQAFVETILLIIDPERFQTGALPKASFYGEVKRRFIVNRKVRRAGASR
jgi:hypothetical protein